MSNLDSRYSVTVSFSEDGQTIEKTFEVVSESPIDIANERRRTGCQLVGDDFDYGILEGKKRAIQKAGAFVSNMLGHINYEIERVVYLG
jgi:hypothetical protein